MKGKKKYMVNLAQVTIYGDSGLKGLISLVGADKTNIEIQGLLPLTLNFILFLGNSI